MEGRLIVLEGITLDPNERTGGWTISYMGQPQNFTHLNDAVEGLLELALVISVENVARANRVGWEAVQLKDCLESYRHMVMTWYQSAVPDPHAVEDLNKI